MSDLGQIRIGGRTYDLLEDLRGKRSDGRECYRAREARRNGAMRAIQVFPYSSRRAKEHKEHLGVLKRITDHNRGMARIFEFQPRGGHMYVVMEWIEGRTLRLYLDGLVKQKQGLSAERAFRMIYQLAHTVVYLNNKTLVIHGDLHPGNIMRRRDPKLHTDTDNLVIIDFGSAWRIERTMSRPSGDGWKQEYSSPEQLQREQPINARSDQFSVSVLFYEMLCRQYPYDGRGGAAGCMENPPALTPPSQGRYDRRYWPDHLWNKIDAAIAKGLALKPDDRYDNGGEWLKALRAIDVDFKTSTELSPLNRAVLNVLHWMSDRFDTYRK